MPKLSRYPLSQISNKSFFSHVTPSAHPSVTRSPPHSLYNPIQSLRPLAAQYIPSGLNFSKSTHSTNPAQLFNKSQIRMTHPMATQQRFQPWASQVGSIHINSSLTTGDTPLASPRRRAIYRIISHPTALGFRPSS